ncbi:type II toxin-antitoxin system VapC family toxin [Nocardioides sp.]|uniref:type II toxin-antitoxin system VapC family toxin n=1 Tax=Nocardioides sp. TaxID=35761 RepID=UPI001D87BF72|nr:type II toxin-antitoxin system VapC family toxin [Nocardioides sp.]MBU1802927.1 type II toxin-antitoxin system VapC family toxin [Actinomycetota bacterium]
MIVIDTNVISEMMRDNSDPTVLEWTATAGQLHTTTITLAEVEYGIARLPAGRRRDQLTSLATELFADLQDLILPFDVRAAHRYAEIVAGRDATGRPIATADAQIAAVCAAREATLATRNISDFESTGIGLVDPWQALLR